MASMLALARSSAVIAASVFAALATGCVHSPERLPRLDRQFYENLATERDQREFLRLKKSERHAYLVDKKLWQAWESLSPEEREAAWLAEEPEVDEGDGTESKQMTDEERKKRDEERAKVEAEREKVVQ